MAVQIQMRRGTAATWTSSNPVLAQGEFGVETDTLKYKFGDGSTAWNSLSYGVFDGASGGFVYGFSTSTPDADPGDGALRFNNATFLSITEIYIDNLDANGADVSAWIDTFDDSTSAARGLLKITKRNNSAIWRLFTVTGSVVDGTGYRKVTVTPISSAGSLSDADEISVLFTPSGSAGFASGYRFNLDGASNADSDPTGGYFRYDNATFGSVTYLYFDNLDDGGVDVTAWLDSLDDSSNTGNKGTLRIEKATDSATYREVIVTGAVVDGTGYRKIPVTPLVSAGTHTDQDQFVVTFSRAGDEGSVASGGAKTLLVTADKSFMKDSEDSDAVKDATFANVRKVVSPRGHIYGLTLSNNATDATNDIDIAAGEAASIDSDPVLMVLASGITKRLDAAWAVGTGNGGLDTGTIANGTYHVWLIQRSDTGVVDVLFSTSASSPTMPTNYDRKRRIGSIMRESATIVPFWQDGDRFRRAGSDDLNGTNLGTSAITVDLGVPTGIVVWADIVMRCRPITSGKVQILISALDEPNSTPAGDYFTMVAGEASTDNVSQSLYVKTNTSGQIRYRQDVSGASDFARVMTFGWIDRRGRDG